MTKRELIEALEALDVADDAPILCRDFGRDGEMVGVSTVTNINLLPVIPNTYEPSYGGRRRTDYIYMGKETFESVPGIVIDF
jgi:hypothetical protein